MSSVGPKQGDREEKMWFVVGIQMFPVSAWEEVDANEKSWTDDSAVLRRLAETYCYSALCFSATIL